MLRKYSFLLLAASLTGLSLPAMSNGLGIDVVRLIDENQDGGMSNVFWQGYLSQQSAFQVGYASGDNTTVLDVGYKYYLGRYMSGAFLQAGLGYYDGNNDDDIGFVGAIGYDKHLAKHFAVTGSVKMVAGVDEGLIGYGQTPVFQPTLGFMLTF